MPSISPSIKLHVAARSSLLSRAQIEEFRSFLSSEVELWPIFLETHGDIDQKTSLRMLGKTDFFTREIDEQVLSGCCDLAVHSAKDLPDPLPLGLSLIAVTKGMDSRDALVLREGETVESLPSNAIIATSSERRVEAVHLLRQGFRFMDLRGTIEERLRLLEEKQADGVVVAEAALIRLKLTHMNRVYLSGPTAEGQGQLAVIGRTDRKEMLEKLLLCHNVKNQFVFFIPA